MIPEDLGKVLARWDPTDTQKPGSTAPRVLYTIPNGGNPTGASMTYERKQEVYEVSSVYFLNAHVQRTPFMSAFANFHRV